MTIIRATTSALGSPAAAPAAAGSRTARFGAHPRRSGAVIILHGEIDAANVCSADEYLGCYTGYCEWLVLDFSGLDFAGTALLPVLRAIHDRCAAVRIAWALVTGPAMSRVLRLAGCEFTLPVTASLPEALATVSQTRKLPTLS